MADEREEECETCGECYVGESAIATYLETTSSGRRVCKRGMRRAQHPTLWEEENR